MLNTVLAILIPFIIKQIDKFGHETDWAKIKADANLKIKEIVPGEMFDNVVCELVDKVVDSTAAFLQDEVEMKKIVGMCQNKQFLPAIEELFSYLFAQMSA